MVDNRNGNLIQEIKKGEIIREPLYKTAEHEGWGTDHNGNRAYIRKGDYIDMDGNWLDPSKTEDMFHRVPIYDEKTRRFRTEKLAWEDIEERAHELREKGQDITPEKLAFKIKIENQILQARGQSITAGQLVAGSFRDVNTIARVFLTQDEQS